jgi:hypothetical protein
VNRNLGKFIPDFPSDDKASDVETIAKFLNILAQALGNS